MSGGWNEWIDERVCGGGGVQCNYLFICCCSTTRPLRL
jgi:hypothetical protein